MNYILTDKEPKLPLKYFEDISAIPHGSYNEKAISAFIADTAAKLGLYAPCRRAQQCGSQEACHTGL